MEHRSQNRSAGSNKGLWDMVMDPSVSTRHFQRVLKECDAHKEELVHLRRRSVDRREFVRLSAHIASAFGLASMVGSAVAPTPVRAQPSSKGVKKGLIRIGYINTLDCELLDYILEKKGIFQSMGWDAKFLGQASGPQVMEAFIANEIDFAYVGSNTPGLAAQRGVPSKLVVGGMMAMGGWNVSNAVYNAGVTNLPQFFEYARKRKEEGKPVAIATQVPGTLSQACCVITIKDYGMNPEKDIDIKYLPAPEVASTVVSGVVDGNAICEQYDSFPEYFNKGRVIAHCLDKGDNMMRCDGLPEQTYTQCTALAVRPGMPKEMIQAVVEGHKRACDWMAQNIDESIKIAASIAGTPGPVEWVAMFRRARWHYGLNYESIDSVWNNTMHKIGLAKKKFKVDEMIDTENAVELKAGNFKSQAGVVQSGPVDVTSEDFRRAAWAEANRRFKKASSDHALPPFARQDNPLKASQCGIV